MQPATIHPQLPIPAHFIPEKVSQVWRVPYQARAEEARAWSKTNQLQPSAQDQFNLSLVLVDVQNTFCIPDFELFVGGRSGKGAVEDNIRLSQFIYHNLGAITSILLTLDTHQATQIFHPIFLVNEKGENPPPYTLIHAEDIRSGHWKFNPSLAEDVGVTAAYGQEMLVYYTTQLAKNDRFDLTIWPYHAMLGGIGHALVSAIEEAVFFHTIARYSGPEFEIKGTSPFTEYYSALGPEILEGPQGERIAEKSSKILSRLRKSDAMVITGQAKSHCVAWTIKDLLEQIQQTDPAQVGKVYLLEDCSSPVVVPGAIDYTDQADLDFARFASAGMHVVRSTDPIPTWPGIIFRQ
ncbi:MAG: isochorismatase [Anaerolineales bacterium]